MASADVPDLGFETPASEFPEAWEAGDDAEINIGAIINKHVYIALHGLYKEIEGADVYFDAAEPEGVVDCNLGLVITYGEAGDRDVLAIEEFDKKVLRAYAKYLAFMDLSEIKRAAVMLRKLAADIEALADGNG